MIAIKKTNWDEVPLKFLFSKRVGGSWGTDPDLEDKGVICLRAADFITHELRHSIHDLTRRKYEDNEIASKQLRKGDLILEKSGGGEKQLVGRVISFELDEVALCSNFLELLRPHQAFLYSRFGTYLFYSLWSTRSVLKYIKQTTGIQNLDAEEYLSQVVEIPPLFQQRQIAEYLDRATQKIDALIAAKKRLLELLTEKRRALITQAVTRGLNPNVPLRDSGSILIGRAPRHWQVTYLRRVISQMDYGISESVGVEGKVAILRMGDIYDGEIHYKNVGFVQEVDPLLMLAPGDLLFNRTNSLDQVGKVGIFREYQEFPVSFASYLVRIRCGKDVLPDFLNYSLNSDPMLKWARSEALPAIGQANLNPNRYSYLPIVIPPIEEQIEILEYLQISTDKIDRLFSATRSTISLLQERRTSLISAAVTGQLPIPD